MRVRRMKMATESSMFFRFSCRSNWSSFSRRKRCWTGGLGPSATHLPLPLSDGYTLLRARVPSQPLPQPQERLSLICSHPHSLLAAGPSPEKSQHSMLLHHFSSTAVEVEDGMCEGVTHKATREGRLGGGLALPGESGSSWGGSVPLTHPRSCLAN